MKHKNFLILTLCLFSLAMAGCQQVESTSPMDSTPPKKVALKDVKRTEEKNRGYGLRPHPKHTTIEGASLIQTNDCMKASEEDMRDLQTEERGKIFGIKEIRTDSFITVDFRYIEECCKEFWTYFHVKDDTLWLKLHTTMNKPCDCLCIFAYQLRLASDKYSFKVAKGEK